MILRALFDAKLCFPLHLRYATILVDGNTFIQKISSYLRSKSLSLAQIHSEEKEHYVYFTRGVFLFLAWGSYSLLNLHEFKIKLITISYCRLLN